jgi:hypothetical protein
MNKAYIILILFLTISLKVNSQIKSDTLANLKSEFIINLKKYKDKSLKNILDKLPYEIQAYALISSPPSDFKSSCAMASFETLKLRKIIIYFREYKVVKLSLDEILKGGLTKIDSTTLNKIKLEPKIVIELKNFDNHPFFNNILNSTYFDTYDKWTENIKNELSLPKYIIQNIKTE